MLFPFLCPLSLQGNLDARLVFPFFHDAPHLVILQLLHQHLECLGRDDIGARLVVVEVATGAPSDWLMMREGFFFRSLMLTDARA